MTAFNTLYTDATLIAAAGTAPKALDWRGGVGALEIIVTGTINFDLQSTNADINAGDTAQWLVDSAGSTGITASKWITFSGNPRFIRIYTNSITAGATVRLLYTQTNA
jgi:hypothetical protein